MSERYHVILSNDALFDLEQIAEFIRLHSPQNAARVAQVVLDAIDSLRFMPHRFKRVGVSRKRGTPVHSLVVHPYLIYYCVQDAQAAVYVLTIRHGSRRQPRRFS